VPDGMGERFPEVPFDGLDTLWFQVAGTLCNLACTHCFVASSPTNRSHPMLGLDAFRERLREAERLGVREYYFTGGEPFLHRDLPQMIEEALRLGPVHVLTNGIPLTAERCARLAELDAGSRYSLEIRVSLDGWDAAGNDAIRGAGAFEGALAGIRRLAGAGLEPVVTVTEALPGAGTSEGRTRLLSFLREIGLARPRLKVLPLFRLGAEERRDRAYEPWETLAGVELTPDQASALQCASGRMVTAKGVYVCPILVEEPAARMGETLAATLRPFALRHPACHTCHAQGVTCRT
jgi:molybdenum cofactor biosynthesis enzyme MoaA